MLTIDALKLRLPPGFEGRAGAIVRLLGDELARLPLPPGNLSLPALEVPPLHTGPGAGNQEVASSIARAIGHRLARRSF